MPDTNRDLLIAAAQLLKPLLDDLVFVGGCATGLLITDPAAPSVRSTLDVDVIAEITSYSGYTEFGERLAHVGFGPDTRQGAPLCRWRHDDITLDVMPLDETILGFSNRWYAEAMKAAATLDLDAALRIRRITAPFFLATKLEAFKGRGRGDFFASHDLEDLLSVIDGRSELLDETQCQSVELRSYIAEEFTQLLKDSRFLDALPGHLLPDSASQARIPQLIERIERLTQ